MRLITTFPENPNPHVPPMASTYRVDLTAEELLRIWSLSNAEEGGANYPRHNTERLCGLIASVEPNIEAHAVRVGLMKPGTGASRNIFFRDKSVEWDVWSHKVYQ